MNSKTEIKPIDCTISPEIQKVISMIEWTNEAISILMIQRIRISEHKVPFIGEKEGTIAGTP